MLFDQESYDHEDTHDLLSKWEIENFRVIVCHAVETTHGKLLKLDLFTDEDEAVWGAMERALSATKDCKVKLYAIQDESRELLHRFGEILQVAVEVNDAEEHATERIKTRQKILAKKP